MLIMKPKLSLEGQIEHLNNCLPHSRYFSDELGG